MTGIKDGIKDMHDLSIAVVGSVNLDIVARVDRFPLPGETLTDAILSHFPGGKGANQAIAAQRLGARVSMIACVGDDPAADQALASLRAEGVDLRYCRSLDAVCTGTALILVSAEGENQIVVAPGANAAFLPERLDLPACDAVIAQLEVPMETVLKAARQTKGLFCLNAAPARAVPQAVLEQTGLLIVNELEAQAIGRQLRDYRGLLAITYGSQGATLSRNGSEIARAQPPEVEVVDTTGAGDAFTAALTVGTVAGMAPEKALQHACVVGALTTTRLGAQSSPLAAEVARHWRDC
jgi:ribokinase